MLLLEKLPMAILAAGSGFVTILAQEVAIKSLVKVPLPDRVANALVSYVIYLEHFVVPVNLAAFYPNAPRSLWDLSTIGSLLLILTLSACAWFLRRRVPSLLVGWIWFLVMLLPVIGLLQVGDQAMADRYTYLPMIGPCLLLFQLPAGGTRASPRRAVAAACILTVLLIASWRQTTFWRNSVTLWNRALACTDDNWLARMNLGAALFTLGQTESAIAEFHEAIHLNPQSFQAHNNLGKMCLILHRYDEAIANFQAALSIEEGDAILYTNLGTALRQKGRVAEAVEAWYKALQIIEAGKEVDLAGKLRRRLESYRLGKPAYDDP
jgi:tetratricopeptide (TPR) repeat protein